MAKVTDEWVMQQRQSTWWAGSKNVEPHMPPVAAALSRHIDSKEPAWADIYNRAYEAVHNALHDKTARDGDYWRNRALKADMELLRCYKDIEELTTERTDLKAMLADAGIRNAVLEKRLDRMLDERRGGYKEIWVRERPEFLYVGWNDAV